MNLIYHITTEAEWNKQSDSDHFTHMSLDKEGFIHCSTADQVLGVLGRYFEGQDHLLKLSIDPTLLTAELKYEMATIGEKFPHIYGTINKGAIVKVEKI